MLIIRGRQPTHHIPPPQATSPSSGRRPHRSATFLNQAPAVGVGGAGIPLRATLPLAPRRNRDRETGFYSTASTNHRVNDNKRNVTYPFGGWEAVSVVPPSQCGFPWTSFASERDDVIGVAQLRCLSSALPAFSTTVAWGANDRHSGRGVRPRRGFYWTEIIE